jgi:hypothetical protein
MGLNPCSQKCEGFRVQLIGRIFVKSPEDSERLDFEGKNSEIAIFRQQVLAGCINIAGFLKFSIFLSEL